MATKKQKTKLNDLFSRVDKNRTAMMLGYVFVFLISIVVSALSVDFNIERIATTSFIGNLAFNYSMAIIVLMLSIRDGDVFFQTRTKGDFAISLLSLKESCKRVVERGLSSLFPQYWDKRYQQEKQEFVKQQLELVQINKREILDLSDEEIKKLKTEPLLKKWTDGKETVFQVINDEQYDAVMKYKKGKYHFPKMAAQTFFSRGSENTYLIVATVDARKKKLTGWTVGQRLGMLLITSTLVSILVFDALSGSPTEAIANTVARLFNIFTSMAYGYSVAFDKNKLDLLEVEYKEQIIQEFMNDYDTGIFLPINIDEEIRTKLRVLDEQQQEKERIAKAESKSEEQEAEQEIVLSPDEYEKLIQDRENKT